MVSAADAKYRLSGGAANTSKGSSVGGVKSTIAGGLIASATPNNLFLGIPANDTVLGKVYYRCWYIENGHASETMKDCSFFLQSNTNAPSRTRMSWGLGTSPINGTEQGPFSDQQTSPANVVFKPEQNAPPEEPNIGDLKFGQHKAVWGRLTLFANSTDKRNDNCVFLLRGKIPTGGTAPPPDTPGRGVPPTTPTALNFIIVGDWDMKTVTKKVVASAEADNPEACVDCGDHAYGGSQSDWLNGLRSLKSKMVATVGNHDSTSTVKNQFGISSFPHFIDKENVRFISLDTQSSMSGQKTKMEEYLKSASESATIDWIVINMHKPFYTANGSSGHAANEVGQVDNFAAMFDKYKVDLVCQGHNHNMQRTYPVKYNSASKLKPIITQTGNGPYTKGNGTVYLISGAGGHDSGSSLYGVEDNIDANVFANDSNNGYANAVLSGTNNNTLTVTFKDEDGDSLHTFVING